MLVRSPLVPVREQSTHQQSSFLRCAQPSVDIAQQAVQKPLCRLHEPGRLIWHLLTDPSRPLKVFLNLNSDENEEKSYVEASFLSFIGFSVPLSFIRQLLQILP